MPGVKELKGILWHEGFEPHPGWETKILSKDEFRRLKKVLHPGEEFDPTVAFVTEIDWKIDTGGGTTTTAPQKYLVMREDATPEEVAHEEAHTERWNYIKQLRSVGVEEYVRDEVRAWLGAKRKRGGKLRTAWLTRVGFQALNDFPGESPIDIVNLTDAVMREEGDPGLTDDNKEKLAAELEGLNSQLRVRKRKARKKAHG